MASFKLDDKHYNHLKKKIVEFFEKKLNEKLEEDPSIPIHKYHFDLLIQTKSKSFGAEIKTFKETSTSPQSWWSYWTKGNKKNLQKELIEKVEKSSLNALEKGFVAVIEGQMKEYTEKLKLNEMYLIQEGEQFKDTIKKVLDFLGRKGEIEKLDNIIFAKIKFK